MKIFRIILGVVLLIAAGKEFGLAGRDVGNFYSPPILVASFLFILFSAWLIGGAIKKERLKIRDYIKYVGICFFTFIIIAYIGIALYEPPKSIVEYNGIEISIGEFMEGNRRVIPNEEERRQYCECIVEKLSSPQETRLNYKSEFEEGSIDKIIENLEAKGELEYFNIEECLRSIEMVWTDHLANSMKDNWKEDLMKSDIDVAINIDKYCNCMIEEFRKYPLKKIMDPAFQESELADSIMTICTEKSKN